MKKEKISDVLINAALFIFAAISVSTFCLAVWRGIGWLLGLVLGN